MNLYHTLVGLMLHTLCTYYAQETGKSQIAMHINKLDNLSQTAH